MTTPYPFENLHKSIALVGMPGAGKTTVGKALAKALGWEFIDTDRLIESQYKTSLQTIINEQGKTTLQQYEENVVLGIQTEKAVISTGGSVVFSHAATSHLKHLASIIYLDVSLETLDTRIDNFEQRGLVKDAHQSLEDIFLERLPLYQAVSDITIDNNLLSAEQAKQAILQHLCAQQSS